MFIKKKSVLKGVLKSHRKFFDNILRLKSIHKTDQELLIPKVRLQVGFALATELQRFISDDAAFT